MKRRYYKSFSQKLLFYLVTALILIGGLMLIFIYTSSRKFINENAFSQANGIATNIFRLLERRIENVENIPQTISGLFGTLDTNEINTLPSKILQAYPFVTACTLHCHPTKDFRDGFSLQAQRTDSPSFPVRIFPFSYTLPEKSRILRKNRKNSYWQIEKQDAGYSVLCYCQPIRTEKRGSLSHTTLELHIPIKYLTDFIQDIKIFNSGYCFLTGHDGQFLVHPDTNIVYYRDLNTFAHSAGIDYSNVLHRFTSPVAGSGTVYKKGRKYYLYHAPLALLNWHLGIICPYRDIQFHSNKFCWLMFTILGTGFLILYICIVRIIRHALFPLGVFTENIRKITGGQWNAKLPDVSGNKELKELYEAFKFMQNSLTGYIQRLKTTTAQNEEIITEINLARKIQKRFLPKKILLPENVELYGKLKQSKSVGGDLYEYFLLDNRLYFAMGDVSGKGIPASLYMASVVKLFRYIAGRQHSTASICNIINTHMCDNTEDDMYVTMFIGILDLSSGFIHYTNAGHPQPFLISPGGKITAFGQEPDAPIGILEDYGFREYTCKLAPATQLLLYTDGVTDAEDPEGRFFGKEQLVECIRTAVPRTPRTIVTGIIKSINGHIGNSEQSDDLTVLDILYKGITGEPEF